MVTNLQKAHRSLRHGQQAAFERRYGHRRPRVRVDHAGHFRPRRMHGAMDNVAGLVHAVAKGSEIGRAENLPIVVDLDQARRGNLLIQHPVGIDQKRSVLTRHARRNVVGDHVGHGVELDEAITRRKIDARLPLRLGTCSVHHASREPMSFAPPCICGREAVWARNLSVAARSQTI